MTKRIASSVCVTLFLCCTLQVSLAETAEMKSPVMAERQIMVEMIMLKVELEPGNEFGLDWGKENKMRKDNFASIAKWLRSQGELKVLCNRRFLATDGKQMRVQTGVEAPVMRESRVYPPGRRRLRRSTEEMEPGKRVPTDEEVEMESKRRTEPQRFKTFEYKDFGNMITLEPRIREDRIAMDIHLVVKFMQGRSGVEKALAYAKYDIQTTLSAKNGETSILDDMMVNETVSGDSGVAKTALVTFITPRIVK